MPEFIAYRSYGINNGGQAAISSGRGSFVGHAMLYDGNSLLDLPLYRGKTNTQSQALGINDRGWIVGWCDKAGVWETALWRDGQIVDIARAGQAHAINNADNPQITGYTSTRKGVQAFLWQNGSYKVLPFAQGDAINDKGEIAGQRDSYLGPPCYWSEATGLVDLPVLGGSGPSENRAINNAGQCVGFSSAPDGTFHSVIWQVTPTGVQRQDLGPCSDGQYLWTAGINGSGTIVGGRSLRWDPENGFVDVSTMVALPDGWILNTLTDINESGQITGYCQDPSGLEQAMILNPLPIP
jgi:uncharacterized membrane protein